MVSTPMWVRRGRVSVGRMTGSGPIAIAAAVLVFVCLGGIAAAASATLGVSMAQVGGRTESIVVDSNGATVYEMSGESFRDLRCVSQSCLIAWPPVEVRSRSVRVTTAAGVPGRLTILHRVHGQFYQLMLNGHPLYFSARDAGRSGWAKGDGVTAFGGTWHVVHALNVSRTTQSAVNGAGPTDR